MAARGLNSDRKIESRFLYRFRLFWVYQKSGLYLKTAIFSPDRFVTVAAFIMAVLLISIEMFFSDLDRVDRHLIVFFLTLVFSLIVTLYVTRKDPSRFSEILSETSSTSYLIDVFCAESQLVSVELYRASEDIGGNENGELKIYEVAQKLRVNLQMIDCLKVIISKRLLIQPRVFSDDIVKFSASIYMDRVIKKTFNSGYAGVSCLNGAGGLDEEDDKGEEFDILKRQNEAIGKYCAETVSYLDEVKQHSELFDQFEFLFRTGSISAAMAHLATILERNKPYNYGKYKIIYQIQSAYRNGALWNRLICSSIAYYLAADDDCKHRALGRIDFMLGIGLESSGDMSVNINKGKDFKSRFGEHVFSNWASDMDWLVSEHRGALIGKQINEAVSHELKKTEGQEGRMLFVTTGYSRAVRSVIKKTLPNKDGYEIFCLGDDDRVNNFGTRLLRHQITREQYYDKDADGEPIDSDEKGLNGRVLYGTRSGLHQILEKRNFEKDRLVVFLGCDELGGEYEDTAYLTLSPDYFNDIFKNVSHYDVWIFGGEYKRGVKYWIDRMKPEKDHVEDKLFSDLEGYLNQSNESNIHLHKWKRANTDAVLRVFGGASEKAGDQ